VESRVVEDSLATTQAVVELIERALALAADGPVAFTWGCALIAREDEKGRSTFGVVTAGGEALDLTPRMVARISPKGSVQIWGTVPCLLGETDSDQRSSPDDAMEDVSLLLAVGPRPPTLECFTDLELRLTAEEMGRPVVLCFTHKPSGWPR
jgi:hypothetical protein